MRQEIKITLYLNEFVNEGMLIIFFTTYYFGGLEDLFNFILVNLVDYDGDNVKLEESITEQLFEILSEVFLDVDEIDSGGVADTLTSESLVEMFANLITSMAVTLHDTVIVHLNNGSLSGCINYRDVVGKVIPYSYDGNFSGYVDIIITQCLTSPDIVDKHSVPYLKHGGCTLYRRGNIPHSPILPILRGKR